MLSALLPAVPAARAGSIFDDDWTPPRREEAPPAAAGNVTPPPRPGTPPAVTPPAVTPPTVTPPPATTDPQPPAQPPALPAAVPPVTEAPARATARLAVPAAGEQATSRKLFKEVFAAELAERAAPARRALADQLLAHAARSADRPTELFVLLGGAYDAGKEANSLPACLRAAAMLGERFEVDALALRESAALRMSLKADAPDRAAANVKAGLELIDELAAAGEHARAMRVGGLLQTAAAAQPPLRASVQQRVKALELERAAEARLARALEKLRTSPDDPAANLAAGSHYCFQMEQWAQGLPMLAKGSDVALRAASTAELAKPAGAEALANVGDAWWDVAARQPAAWQPAVRRHAVTFYTAALDGTVGLRRVQVERRIAEAGALNAAAIAAAGGAGTGTQGRGPSGGRWAPLFNGRDLSGWDINRVTTWEVKDGGMLGRGRTPVGVLRFDGPELHDLTLRATVIPTAEYRNAILFHVWDKPGHGNAGYFVSVGADRIGSVYVLGGDNPAPVATARGVAVKPGAPAVIELQVSGTRVTVSVNGQEVVNKADAIPADSKGLVGLRPYRHSEMRVQQIELRAAN